MHLLLQQLANGVALGSVYAVFAVGFALVLATMGIFNVAHGSFAMWGAIVALWAAISLELPIVACVAIGLVAAGLIGVAVDLAAFGPLRRRGGLGDGSMVASIGAWMVLGGLAQHVTDARVQRFPVGAVPDRLVSLGGVSMPFVSWMSIAVAVAVVAGLHLFLTRTLTGTSVRAVGDDAESASLSGVSPRRVLGLTAFLSAAVAGVAGILSGLSTGSVSFTMGEGLLLRGFAAVIVGGFGDIRGVAGVGVAIGVSEVLAGQYVSNSFRDALTFGILVLVLVIRPTGVAPRALSARP